MLIGEHLPESFANNQTMAAIMGIYGSNACKLAAIDVSSELYHYDMTANSKFIAYSLMMHGFNSVVKNTCFSQSVCTLVL